jgi:hypothetical protein
MRKALIASLLFAFVIGEKARAENPPSRILINGVVLTMDKSDRVAQAAAINGDRIESVLTMMAGKVVHASEPFGTLKDK